MTLPESAPPTIDPNVSMKNPPEYLTPMSTPMTALAWPCVNSPRLSTVKPDIVNRMKDSREVNMTQPENAPPTMDPNVSMKNLPEYLTLMSTPMTALAWPCVNSPRLQTVKTEIINRMKDSREVDMILTESTLPTIDQNVSMKNWEDGVCWRFPTRCIENEQSQPRSC